MSSDIKRNERHDNFIKDNKSKRLNAIDTKRRREAIDVNLIKEQLINFQEELINASNLEVELGTAGPFSSIVNKI